MQVRLLERKCNGCRNKWMATAKSMQEFCSKSCEIINGNRSGQWGKEKKRKKKEPPKGAPLGNKEKLVTISMEIIKKESKHPNEIQQAVTYRGKDEDNT